MDNLTARRNTDSKHLDALRCNAASTEKSQLKDKFLGNLNIFISVNGLREDIVISIIQRLTGGAFYQVTGLRNERIWEKNDTLKLFLSLAGSFDVLPPTRVHWVC